MDYQIFIFNDEVKEINIAATLLKIQERKTAKGNSYALLKLTDLSGVFELFIFSDILELNREILQEGSSLIFTLTKTISNDEEKTKRINVRKIASLKELFNSSIKEITLNLDSESELKEINSFFDKEGDTIVNISISNDISTYKFKLKKTRNIDRKSINLLRSRQFNLHIH